MISGLKWLLPIQKKKKSFSEPAQSRYIIIQKTTPLPQFPNYSQSKTLFTLKPDFTVKSIY